ncbi:DNA-binding response regulator [Allostella vacuolata]|nr:DNA-binding response regulator [Stella vacuolata]
MSNGDEIVFVVDDDARVRLGFSELLESWGWRVETFATAADYAARARPDLAACLILDVRLPDISGLEFQAQQSADAHPPIVFVTGHGDIPSTVRAMRLGAVDFLTKPVGESALVAAVRDAIGRDRLRRQARSERDELERRFATLTPREHDVLPLVVSGLLNKQAAAELGVSQVTIEMHRRRIMQKMQASSLPELVRMAERLHVPVRHSRRSGHS